MDRRHIAFERRKLKRIDEIPAAAGPQTGEEPIRQ
jgi:hypothetical protein